MKTQRMGEAAKEVAEVAKAKREPAVMGTAAATEVEAVQRVAAPTVEAALAEAAAVARAAKLAA